MPALLATPRDWPRIITGRVDAIAADPTDLDAAVRAGAFEGLRVAVRDLGATGTIATLAASGLPSEAFLYLGYLPRKSGERQAFLGQVAGLPYTLIFLETPHRLQEALADLETVLGDRPIAVARELTKLHEEIWRGGLSGARVHFEKNEPRGEFTLVVAGKPPDGRQKWTEEKVMIAVRFGVKLGEPPSALAKRVAEESGWDRREIYKRIIALE